jgi:hypothetical protein
VPSEKHCAFTSFQIIFTKLWHIHKILVPHRYLCLSKEQTFLLHTFVSLFNVLYFSKWFLKLRPERHNKTQSYLFRIIHFCSIINNLTAILRKFGHPFILILKPARENSNKGCLINMPALQGGAADGLPGQ